MTVLNLQNRPADNIQFVVVDDNETIRAFRSDAELTEAIQRQLQTARTNGQTWRVFKLDSNISFDGGDAHWTGMNLPHIRKSE